MFFFLLSSTIFTVLGFFTTPGYIIGLILIVIWLAYVFMVWHGERKKRQTMTEIHEDECDKKHGDDEDKAHEAAMVDFLSNLETQNHSNLGEKLMPKEVDYAPEGNTLNIQIEKSEEKGALDTLAIPG